MSFVVLLIKDVEESVNLLKEAAKTRKVPKDEVLSALSVIEKAKLDPSRFLDTLGGSKSPGRTWMLIFTSEVDIFLNPWCSCLQLYVSSLLV